jgi:2-polyprenyl-3-methyl-5-hydroxy-6-metoxy-1,4-benzoquinol methylase
MDELAFLAATATRLMELLADVRARQAEVSKAVTAPETRTLEPAVVAAVETLVAEKSMTAREAVSDFPDDELMDATDFVQLQQCLAAWPDATPPDRVVPDDSEGAQAHRGVGILAILVPDDLRGKRFLDFGCGDGFVVQAAEGTADVAAGYDIAESPRWGNMPTSLTSIVTTNFETVGAQGPFDIVLLHDVLDHCKDPVRVLRDAASVCSAGGRLVIRCHPWCGRHGGHLYKQMNKAYLQLVFSGAELRQLGLTPLPVTEQPSRLLHPLAAYEAWFKAAGFTPEQVSEKDVTQTRVEQFFIETDVVAKRLKRHWTVYSDRPETSAPAFAPTFQMGQSFVDYEITL